MGKPQSKLPEILKKLNEITEEIYSHGEGEYHFEVRTSLEKRTKTVIIRAGKTFRFTEKILELEKKYKNRREE